GVRALARSVRETTGRRVVARAGGARGGRVVRAPGRVARTRPGGVRLLSRVRPATRSGLAPRTRRNHHGRCRPERLVARGLGEVLVAAAAVGGRSRSASDVGGGARRLARLREPL